MPMVNSDDQMDDGRSHRQREPMSITLVENEIRRFLSSSEREVICVRGKWGVGKTYAWKRYVQDARAAGTIALARYSYVSLFGVNSLDELKYAVFENSVKSSNAGAEPNLNSLGSNTTAAIETFVRKSVKVIQQTPVLKNYIGGIPPVWFASVDSTVVCIDDFERRGRSLAVRDVFGLINNLKEMKKCKICLILNDEDLQEGEEASDFGKYLEKVVDTTLKFDPSPEDCARIALIETSEITKMMAGNCIKIGVSNIRVIKKIERSVHMIEPILVMYDKRVLEQAVHSLVLFGWIAHEPTRAPSFEFLEKRGSLAFPGDSKEESLTPRDAAWNALLLAYGFRAVDDFDRVLWNGVRDGYFDPELVEKHAAGLNATIKAGNLNASFLAAWEMFHDSFDNDQERILDLIFESFWQGVQYISPMNLNGTVIAFKSLGRSEQAKQMLAHYVQSRGAEPELFNLRHFPVAAEVSDPDVVHAFNDKYASFKKPTNPTTILLRMSAMNSWNPDDIATLSTLPVNQFYSILKSNTGSDLRAIIGACLQFDRIVNATPEMREISKRAKDALKLVGQESAINARRVKAYGVNVDDSDEKTATQ